MEHKTTVRVLIQARQLTVTQPVSRAHGRSVNITFVDLFEEVLYVSVNTAIVMSRPCHHFMEHIDKIGIKLGWHDTQNVLHKYNHPCKPISLTKPLFLGSLTLERLISNHMVSQ